MGNMFHCYTSIKYTLVEHELMKIFPCTKSPTWAISHEDLVLLLSNYVANYLWEHPPTRRGLLSSEELVAQFGRASRGNTAMSRPRRGCFSLVRGQLPSSLYRINLLIRLLAWKLPAFEKIHKLVEREKQRERATAHPPISKQRSWQYSMRGYVIDN